MLSWVNKGSKCYPRTLEMLNIVPMNTRDGRKTTQRILIDLDYFKRSQPVIHRQISIINIQGIDFSSLVLSDNKNKLILTHEMELSREIEYQRRNKQLRRICREYNLTQGSISEKLLSKDILLNAQYKVRKKST